MNEFIEKLKARFSDMFAESEDCVHKMCESKTDEECNMVTCEQCYVAEMNKIANQIAEEYNGGWIEELLEAKKNCSEDSDCSKCPFGQIKDRCILTELQIEGGNNGWIPCSERLPEENVEVLVYIKDCEGNYYYDLTYFHIVWQTEIGGMYSSVIAWKPLPEPYNPKGE